jgi:multidrug efflux pump subunit AcrA (membrane-fusion protein)
MTTTVNIGLDGKKNVLAVPNPALRRDSDGSYVLVPGANGNERRNVRVGFRGTEYTEVLAGARAGERVLTGAAQACQQDASRKKGA